MSEFYGKLGKILLFHFLTRLHISFSFHAFALHLKLKILKQNAEPASVAANEHSCLTMGGVAGGGRGRGRGTAPKPLRQSIDISAQSKQEQQREKNRNKNRANV